jgi:FKBP-type peptidyl-prolyl cis-trans isomerase (trigger factor)
MIEKQNDNYKWKVERRIPLSLVMMILAQMAAMLVWATQLDARVGDMERNSGNAFALNEKFARLEERLDNVRQNMEAIKRQMDHLADKLIRP